MKMQVNKSDILRIGHTAFKYEGNVSFYCYSITADIEEMLLRNILKCFGDYRITGRIDYLRGKGCDEYQLETDLPWEVYSEVRL